MPSSSIGSVRHEMMAIIMFKRPAKDIGAKFWSSSVRFVEGCGCGIRHFGRSKSASYTLGKAHRIFYNKSGSDSIMGRSRLASCPRARSGAPAHAKHLHRLQRGGANENRFNRPCLSHADTPVRHPATPPVMLCPTHTRPCFQAQCSRLCKPCPTNLRSPQKSE